MRENESNVLFLATKKKEQKEERKNKPNVVLLLGWVLCAFAVIVSGFMLQELWSIVFTESFGIRKISYAEGVLPIGIIYAYLLGNTVGFTAAEKVIKGTKK